MSRSRTGRQRGLRVVHVVVTEAFAGTERYVVEVAAELAERGHQVSVVGGEPQAMRRLLPPAVRWLPGASTAQALRSLASSGRADVVHSHTSKADFTALMAAPVTGGRRISTRHIMAPRGYDGLARRLAPLVRRLLARELAVSRYVAENVETRPDAVIVNGVRSVPDGGVFDGADVADGADSAGQGRGRSVLIAQRLAAEKDTGTGLRAWAAAGLAERGWRLRVAGDGEQREELEAAARELGVAGSVDFLGWLPDPTDAYRSAALLLAPAPAEPCGLTVIEAMAHGVPVVATSSGGHAETVGRYTGAALFAPGDAAAAGALLLALAQDEAARVAYGRGLRRLQRAELSLGAHVDALEDVYRDAVAGRRARGAARGVSRTRSDGERGVAAAALAREADGRAEQR